MTTLALLHTSPIHVPTFDRLRDEEAPGLLLRHVVAEELLERARMEGAEAVEGQVLAAVRKAVDAGADAVLCTCSTIGALAERASALVGVPVLRVDRPMAALAVASGSRVTIVAALASTLPPTAELIEEEAARAGRPVRVTTLLVEGAWERFEAGDLPGYLDAIVDSLTTIDSADVVVLAQASMAPAADRVRPTVPVLSSPRLGLRAAHEAARARS